jgi:hypothetical protein
MNPDGGPPNNLVYIELESLDIPDACTEQTPNLSSSNAIFLEVYQGNGSAVATGTYSLGTSGTVMAQAVYATYDASCAKTIDAATTGSITISAANGSTIGGSYTLTFSQGTATGNFSAMICPIFGNGQSDAGCH